MRSTKTWAMGLLAAVLSFSQPSTADASNDRLPKSLWRYFPVAEGTPEEPLPPDPELLKVVPPLRKTPAFPKATRELGMALWWGDYSEILYSEQPPSPADLRRKPVLVTPPGEYEPLVLGLWGITHTGLVTLSVKQSPFPATIRHVEFDPLFLPTPYRSDDHPPQPGGTIHP